MWPRSAAGSSSWTPSGAPTSSPPCTALVQGYALDAIQARAGEPPAVEAVEPFVASVVPAPARKRDAVGLGRDLRFANGAALVHDGEVVHVSAFGGGEVAVRIRPPSRRG